MDLYSGRSVQRFLDILVNDELTRDETGGHDYAHDERGCKRSEPNTGAGGGKGNRAGRRHVNLLILGPRPANRPLNPACLPSV